MKYHKFKFYLLYLLIFSVIVFLFFILYPERIRTKNDGICMCIGVDKSYWEGFRYHKCFGISYDCKWPDVNLELLPDL